MGKYFDKWLGLEMETSTTWQSHRIWKLLNGGFLMKACVSLDKETRAQQGLRGRGSHR